MGRPKKDVYKEIGLAVKDLVAEGGEIADVGLIMGVLGNNAVKWLKDLKSECSTIDEFIEVAKKRSEIALICAMIKNGMGYEYEEIVQEYLKVPAGYDENGKPKMREVPGNRKTKNVHIKGSDSLLKFLAKNYLPEFFQDTQKIEINKKSIEVKEITGDEIRRFAGRLLESVGDSNNE